MRKTFGETIRQARLAKLEQDRSFTVRQVAKRIGVTGSYLSKVERGEAAPPGEDVLRKLSAELELNPDGLMGLLGRIPSDVHEVLLQNPSAWFRFLRENRKASEQQLEQMTRDIRDGDW